MGLDCYVLKKSATDEAPVEIWYGRKENEIHGWMQRESGMAAEDFNCEDLPLTEDVLLRLEQDCASGGVGYTAGFFFGGANDTDEVRTVVRNLISVSRLALAEGAEVRYTSWW